MLAADKLQLQSALKQQATALKEKEFNLHHSNLMTVGTQAAVMASLDITMFIEFQPPHDSEWGLSGRAYLIPRLLKFIYYCLITTAFCCNLLVVCQTTLLSVLGTAMALRGPDGSMITATDGLYFERVSIFNAFGVGLTTTLMSSLVCVWLILSPEAALVCMSIIIMASFRLYQAYLRITKAFKFNEDETVDFTDIFEGPASIRVVSADRYKNARSEGSPSKSRQHRRQTGVSSHDNASNMTNGYHPSNSSFHINNSPQNNNNRTGRESPWSDDRHDDISNEHRHYRDNGRDYHQQELSYNASPSGGIHTRPISPLLTV